jgi:hypothetical protein
VSGRFRDLPVTVSLPSAQAKWILAGLCVVAGLRVFLYAGAFPIFSNIDEHAHVDLVYRYAEGDLPTHAKETYLPLVSKLIVMFGSQEYLKSPSEMKGGVYPPPLWSIRSKAKAEEVIKNSMAKWRARSNHEVHSPPSYYLLAGGWLKIGKGLGFKGGYLLYWLRFLNVGLFALLVYLTAVFTRTGWPQRIELQVAAPLTMAFLPQDVFYSINSDVLSPLLFTGSLILALRWYREEVPKWLLSAALGLLVAATFLTKFTNIGLPLIVAAVVGTRLVKAFRVGRVGPALPAAGTVGLFALAPTVWWLGRNLSLFGSLAATEAKLDVLKWTTRPFERFLEHPIFSFDGFAIFWSSVIETLWAGELWWQGARLKDPWLVKFYVVSTTLLLAAAAINSVRNARRRSSTSNPQLPSPDRQSEGLATALCWGSFALSMLCLAWLSVSFEYKFSSYPSLEFPYLASGRLIAGTLVALVVLWVQGWAVVFSWSPTLRVLGPLMMSAVVASWAMISELLITQSVFSSLHNFFHLP